MSLPSWERGLKLELDLAWMDPIMVAPLVGARIEIEMVAIGSAWLLSLPSWERGLKSSLRM